MVCRGLMLVASVAVELKRAHDCLSGKWETRGPEMCGERSVTVRGGFLVGARAEACVLML